MKIIFHFIVCFLILFTGCRSRVQYVPIENETDSVYIDRLIPYPLPADSASIRALMECDENGKVILRWLDIANSKECKHQSQYNQRNCICRYRGHEIINDIEAAKCSDSI